MPSGLGGVEISCHRTWIVSSGSPKEGAGAGNWHVEQKTAHARKGFSDELPEGLDHGYLVEVFGRGAGKV